MNKSKTNNLCEFVHMVVFWRKALLGHNPVSEKTDFS